MAKERNDNDDSIQRVINLVKVIRILTRENGASITEIANEISVSRWTAARMISRLTKPLGVEECASDKDKRETRYKIDKDNTWTMSLPNVVLQPEEKELFSLLLGIASDVPVLGKNANNLKDKIKWIDAKPSTKIINIPTLSKKVNDNTGDIVKVLLQAIDEGKWINFEYYIMKYEENKQYLVKPLYLFVYEGSLYLRGIQPKSGYYNSFAIERFVGIPTIQKAEKKIDINTHDMENLVADPFGPFGSREPFEAVIRLGSWQGYYADLLNWPENCSIEEQEDGSYILKVITTNDFNLVQWIMKQGSDATVLSPDFLREEVVEWLKNALENYGEDNE